MKVPTDLTDNNVAALYCIEDEVLAASETCFVHSIDCDSLGKKERVKQDPFSLLLAKLTSLVNRQDHVTYYCTNTFRLIIYLLEESCEHKMYKWLICCMKVI